MLAALITVLLSVPFTVAMHGALFAVRLFTRRSLSDPVKALGSIVYRRLGGVPISSSQAVALRQVMRRGPTLVAEGGDCAQAVPQASNVTTRLTRAIEFSRSFPFCESVEDQVPPTARPDSRGSVPHPQLSFSPGR